MHNNLKHHLLIRPSCLPFLIDDFGTWGAVTIKQGKCKRRGTGGYDVVFLFNSGFPIKRVSTTNSQRAMMGLRNGFGFSRHIDKD